MYLGECLIHDNTELHLASRKKTLEHSYWAFVGVVFLYCAFMMVINILTILVAFRLFDADLTMREVVEGFLPAVKCFEIVNAARFILILVTDLVGLPLFGLICALLLLALAIYLIKVSFFLDADEIVPVGIVYAIVTFIASRSLPMYFNSV